MSIHEPIRYRDAPRWSVLRAAVFGVVAVIGGGWGHAAIMGQAPNLLVLAVLAPLVGLYAMLFTHVRHGWVSIAIAALVVQIGVHVITLVASPAAGGEHALHHAQGLHHVSASAAACGTCHATVPMLLMHGAVLALSVLVLACVERVAWRAVRLAIGWIRGAVRGGVPTIEHARTASSALTGFGVVVRRYPPMTVFALRGPPCVTVHW